MALNQKKMDLFINGSNCRTACISTEIVILISLYITFIYFIL